MKPDKNNSDYSAAALELWTWLYKTVGLADWSGGDVIQVVCDWLDVYGIDVDAETWEESVKGVRGAI